MIRSTFLLLLTLGFWGLVLTTCQTDSAATASSAIQIVQGETMGTYYRVSYMGDPHEDLQAGIDSLLVAFNEEVSTYIESSVISRFNQGQDWTTIVANSPSVVHFTENFLRSSAYYEKTQGIFDPTIMPLVNYWGFGYTPDRVETVDSSLVDSLQQLVGFDQLNWAIIEGQLSIEKPAGMELDFSAIAKGYGVDLIGSYLQAQGLQNFFVDIGGEVLAKGDKGPQGTWRAGIAVPQEDAALTEIMEAVPVKDRAIATSGNYRNFYEVDGQKFSHTINPRTGYPERSRLLSASVLANNCATADAYATACMVAGLEEAFALIDSLSGIEGYFIYSDENGQLLQRATKGFAALLQPQ